MGIEILEERFQEYKNKNPQRLIELSALAHQMSGCQQQIRKILDAVTPVVCAACITKCCIGMPCDGYFTAIDYYAYRMLYDVPEVSQVPSSHPWDCSFLTRTGCSLPEDMRPFACVKVNCLNLNQALEERGEFPEFKKLCEALDEIQTKIWELIDEHEE
jgi:hypothetical protein